MDNGNVVGIAMRLAAIILTLAFFPLAGSHDEHVQVNPCNPAIQKCT